MIIMHKFEPGARQPLIGAATKAEAGAEAATGAATGAR